MENTPKADPVIYPRLRGHALELRLPDRKDGTIHAVLMDWHVGNGIATVLAAADGTASLYLSSGGGFIGGGHNKEFPQIREAADRAIAIATDLMPLFVPPENFDLPPSTEVAFYITTSAGTLRAVAEVASMRDGSDLLAALGGAMQQIVTGYRLMQGGQPH